MKKNIFWMLLILFIQQPQFSVVAMNSGTSSVLTINLDDDEPKDAQAALLFKLYRAIAEEDIAFIDDKQVTKEIINTPCTIESADFRATNATALHLAIIFQSDELFDKLIEKGADLDKIFSLTQDENSFENISSLSLAMLQKMDYFVQNLIVKGADINCIGKRVKCLDFELENFTPLQLAIALEKDRLEDFHYECECLFQVILYV